MCCSVFLTPKRRYAMKRANREDEPKNFEEETSDWVKRCRATNWHRGGVIRHESQPYMMGEGFGNCLGLEGSKATIPKTEKQLQKEAEEELIDRLEMIEERKKREAKERSYRLIQVNLINRKRQDGSLHEGFRVFCLAWYKEDWEERSGVYGMPEGVDVALTQFGMLILVPVIEESDIAEGSQYGSYAKDRKAQRDMDGRKFWVKAEVKDAVLDVFGPVKWGRPLACRDLDQFGVKVDY